MHTLLLLLVTSTMGHADPLIGFNARPDTDTEWKLETILGAKIQRNQFNWGQGEMVKGQYKWPHLDDQLTANEAHGLKTTMTLAYGNALYPVKDDATEAIALTAMGKWAAASCVHAAGRIFAWEIFNEPNLEHFYEHFFVPVSSNLTADAQETIRATHYMRMIQALGGAMKAACPNDKIYGGVTSGVPLTFIQKLISQGALKYINGISMHPYRYSSGSILTHKPESMLTDFQAVRKQLDAASTPGSKSLMVSEVQYLWWTPMVYNDPKYFFSKSYQDQANYMVRAILMAYSAKLTGMTIYEFKDIPVTTRETALINERESHFGIINADLSVKPIYGAIQDLLTFIGSDPFNVRMTQSDAHLWVYKFSNGTTTHKYVIWRDDGQTLTSTLTLNGKTMKMSVGAKPILYNGG